MSYRYVPHTADIKVEFAAATLEELYRDATALLRELFVGVSPVDSRERRPVTVRGDTPEETLFRFLNEPLYSFATEAFVPAAFSAHTVSPTHVAGALEGEVFDPARHEPQPEVKAVTRHHLTLERTPGGWRGTVVFDL